jgi:hypothetical protein
MSGTIATATLGPIPAVLTLLEESYRHLLYISSRRSHPESESKDQRTNSATSLETALGSHLCACDLHIIDRFAEAQARGLQLTRNGDYIGAESCFRVERCMATSSSPDQLMLLRDLFLSPAEAYLAHRSGLLLVAKKSLLAGMRANETLENSYRYDFLHAHRLHLATQLVRVEAELSNDSCEAFRMASRILRYMDGSSSDGPTAGYWNTEYRRATPLPLISRMFLHLTGVLAKILLESTPEVCRSSLLVLHDCVENAAEAVWHRKALEWLRLKEVFVRCLPDQFLSQASRYIHDAGTAPPVLWQSVMVDIIATLGLSREPQSQGLSRQILDDSGKWSSVCGEVRRRLASLR